MSDLLRRVQEDFHARLSAAPYFADVALILVRKEYSEHELKQLLSTLVGRAGKAGACIFVQMPLLSVPAPNMPGPGFDVVQSLTVLEHPTINGGSAGTGKTAEALAIAAVQLFHHFIPFGLTQCFKADPAAIVPELSFAGLVAYSVQFSTSVALEKPAKVATPKIQATAGLPSTVTLTCATAGATLLVSTDGSYPTAEYTAPLEISAETLVRAVAELAGAQQSDVAQLRVR